MISLMGSEHQDEVTAVAGFSNSEDEEEQQESSSEDDGGSDVPDDEVESGDDEDDGDEGEEKSGWADAMAKVLGMGKAADPNKPLLLSKAKRDGEKGAPGDADQEPLSIHF